MTGQQLNGGTRVLPLLERLGVVTELMESLKLATTSGRGHVMNKVLAILRHEVRDAEGPLAQEDVAGLTEAMCELEHEAGRLAPLPISFNRHAHLIVNALVRGRGVTMSTVSP